MMAKPLCVNAGRRLRATAAGVALLWGLVALGWLGGAEDVVVDALQAAAGGTAAVLLIRAARRGTAPVGAGTMTLGCASAVWCATDASWAVLDHVGSGAPWWLSAGYTAGTSGFAIGTYRSARALDLRRPGLGSRARSRLDLALLVVSVAVFWWVLVSGHLEGGGGTAVSFATTAADCMFLLAATVCWARSPLGSRRSFGLLLLAAVLLLPTDLAYVLVPLDPAHLGSRVMDLSWFTVSVCLAFATTGDGRADTPADERFATWADGVGAPLVALAVLGAAAVAPTVGSRGLDIVMGLVVVVLGARMVLRFAESLDLNAQLKRTIATVADLADHDDLTGLLARRAFVERAEGVLARTRDDGDHLAVLWVDLDAFKRVNDALGHVAGDTVLRVVADRLRQTTEPTDVVGRLGGDEFVVLRPHADADVGAWAEEVRRRLADPIQVDGVPIRITCSAGLVVADGEDTEVARLLIEGDLALYEAKHGGRARVAHFSPRLRDKDADRRTTAAHVEQHVASGDVIVHYQPVVDLATGRMVGAEALARLPGPDGRVMAPGEFLPHLEAMGLMPRLRDVVLATATTAFARHPELGWLAVNLGSEDLADPHLPDAVARALLSSGLSPDRLVVEVNERVVPETHILGATRLVTDMGVRLALDDFGTGWSSLAQLRDLDLAMVKVDRGVVAGAAVGTDRQAALLTASAAVARALGLTLLCEGIEDADELASAREAGATLGQGFLWAPALDLAAVRALAVGPVPTAGALR